MHVKARYRRVVIQVHDKEFEEATEWANKLIAEDPDSEDFRALLDLIDKAKNEQESKAQEALQTETMIDSKSKKDHYKEKPLREGPLLELLRKREEKPREELLR